MNKFVILLVGLLCLAGCGEAPKSISQNCSDYRIVTYIKEDTWIGPKFWYGPYTYKLCILHDQKVAE